MPRPVQRPTVLAAVVSAPRGLAIDGDDLGRGGGRSGLAQVFDPGGEALCEERAVDRVDDIVERVMTGNACLEGQQAAEELRCIWPQRLISTKSSAPASVPHSTTNRTSGKGYRTFQD